MNRTQTGNQNQRGQINSDNKKNRAYRSESSREQPVMFVGQTITNKAAGAPNIHRHLPAEQMANTPGFIETCTRNEEQNDPRDSERYTQPRIK